jgi:hypothetical protein
MPCTMIDSDLSPSPASIDGARLINPMLKCTKPQFVCAVSPSQTVQTGVSSEAYMSGQTNRLGTKEDLVRM